MPDVGKPFPRELDQRRALAGVLANFGRQRPLVQKPEERVSVARLLHRTLNEVGMTSL